MKKELRLLPEGYESRMERFPEAEKLVCVGIDSQGREAFLHREAVRAWLSMKESAAKDDLTLLLVSAFRSVARQTEILERKLARGVPWEEILHQSAYPGFSEHHTGRAVDIASLSCPDLVEEFEATQEFHWLVKNAGRFGFFLSYPRNNPLRIAYEPWHWLFKK